MQTECLKAGTVSVTRAIQVQNGPILLALFYIRKVAKHQFVFHVMKKVLKQALEVGS